MAAPNKTRGLDERATELLDRAGSKDRGLGDTDKWANNAWGNERTSAKNERDDERTVYSRETCEDTHTGVWGAHHDQPLGDVLRAPMARFAIAGPIVLLAEELPVLLIVLV